MDLFGTFASLNKLAGEQGPGLSAMLAELPKSLEAWGKFQAEIRGQNSEILEIVKSIQIDTRAIRAAIIEEIPIEALNAAHDAMLADPHGFAQHTLGASAIPSGILGAK